MPSESGVAGRRRAYFSLQSAAQALKVVADRETLAAAGLTAPQAGVMYVVAARPGISQRELADALRQRESAAAGMIARLVDAGFVERRPSGTDGRAWEVRATRRGDEALAALAPARERLNQLIEEAVGADGVDRFVDALEAIARRARRAGP